ncbi:hypothetical protein B0H14DRAFT_2621971 [Mycena olivaceomarginata]|nr:hypothetical protein B0H14DRAFT_2621971 [Mycena olivaceomarginata]
MPNSPRSGLMRPSRHCTFGCSASVLDLGSPSQLGFILGPTRLESGRVIVLSPKLSLDALGFILPISTTIRSASATQITAWPALAKVLLCCIDTGLQGQVFSNSIGISGVPQFVLFICFLGPPAYILTLKLHHLDQLQFIAVSGGWAHPVRYRRHHDVHLCAGPQRPPYTIAVFGLQPTLRRGQLWPWYVPANELIPTLATKIQSTTPVSSLPKFDLNRHSPGRGIFSLVGNVSRGCHVPGLSEPQKSWT